MATNSFKYTLFCIFPHNAKFLQRLGKHCMAISSMNKYKSWGLKMEKTKQAQTDRTFYFRLVSPLEPLWQEALPTETSSFPSVSFALWCSVLSKPWSVTHDPKARHSSWKHKNEEMLRPLVVCTMRFNEVTLRLIHKTFWSSQFNFRGRK